MVDGDYSPLCRLFPRHRALPMSKASPMPLFGRQHVRLPIVNWTSVVQRPEARQAPTTRDIDCPHCGEPLRVAIRAINTRCTSCHKHLLLEDVVVRGDSVRTRIVTCGSILIEPSARFSGI